MLGNNYLTGIIYNNTLLNMIQKPKLFNTLFIAVGVAAALLYSSWVVGYFTNWTIGLQGTASELSALDQPGRLLYIFGDLAVLILMIIVAIGIKARSNVENVSTIAFGYALFAIGTASAALMPLRCAPAVTLCNSQADTTAALLHSLGGAVAFLALFGTIYLLNKQKKSKHPRTNMILVLWFTLGMLSLILGQYAVTDSLQIITAALQRIVLLINAGFIVYIPYKAFQK